MCCDCDNQTVIVLPGYINTGLFEGFTQNWIANLLSPPSEEKDVALKIVNASNPEESIYIQFSF